MSAIIARSYLCAKSIAKNSHTWRYSTIIIFKIALSGRGTVYKEFLFLQYEARSDMEVYSILEIYFIKFFS
jgi:hypothetical protein